MGGLALTVTYIGHSGFLLETEDAYFLFDYFKGTIPELKNNKSIIVFPVTDITITLILKFLNLLKFIRIYVMCCHMIFPLKDI